MLEAEAARKRRMAEQYGLTSAPRTVAPRNVETTNDERLQQGKGEPQFVDHATGRVYKNEAALKGAITRREKAAKQ